jgi:GTPase
MDIAENYRCGFVAIIGKPNVGKSTLMNRLIGQKLSIVTPKPQTTRNRIKGFYNDESKQIIFLDTPGILEPRYELQHQMSAMVESSLQGVDLVIFMTDNKFPTDYDMKAVDIITGLRNIPAIALLNKEDLMDPEEIELKAEKLKGYKFETVLTISVQNIADMSSLMGQISEYLPFSPPLYDPEDLSDLPVKFFVQEIIREKIFLMFGKEVPYSSTVTIEKFEEFPNKIEISANVWLERKSQKIIFIGKEGTKIKAVTEAAEKDIYNFIRKRIKLRLWVKIKENWRKKKGALKEFGYLN